MHWYSGTDRRGLMDVPEYLVLPESLTGVGARYGRLAPRVVHGTFDPATHKAAWPDAALGRDAAIVEFSQRTG